MTFLLSKSFNCLDVIMIRRYLKELLESGKSSGQFAEKSSASEQRTITG